MIWDILKNTNPKACKIAEKGDLILAVKTYVCGGCFSYTPKQSRKIKKAELNAKSSSERKAARKGVHARIFFNAYRRFKKALDN